MTVTTGDEIHAIAKRLTQLADRLNQGMPVPVGEYQQAMAAVRAWRARGAAQPTGRTPR
jgi:hypothetical protein